jgi:hypothetical protein
MPKLLSKPQDFDLVFEGGIVAVKAKTERARDEAEDINDKISGPLSRIVKTDSNLSGKSHDQVFKAWKEQLWPEEFEEPLEDGMWKDPDTGEEFEVKDGKRVDSQQDYSQYEGQVMVDEDGNKFKIVGGIPEYVGGD